MTAADFDTLLAGAKLPEKTVTVCLRGDLAAEFDETEAALEKAQQRALEAFDGGAEAPELIDKIEALQEEMRASSYQFRLRAIPKAKFRALVSAHPPRKVYDDDNNETVHEADKYTGVNGETFHDALIVACLVDPPVDEAKWQLIQEKLNDRQFDELSMAAWSVNRSEVDIPFSRAASRSRTATANV